MNIYFIFNKDACVGVAPSKLLAEIQKRWFLKDSSLEIIKMFVSENYFYKGNYETVKTDYF